MPLATARIGSTSSRIYLCQMQNAWHQIKRYQLWDPTIHKIIISRDIIFHEESFQGTKEKQDDEAITSIEFFDAGDEVQAEQA